MTLPFNITDPDAWPSIEREVLKERERRLAGLLTVSPEALVGQQQFIAALDWVIDLGPEGGGAGGRIVAEGTPEQVAKVKESYTGFYLAQG